MIIKLITQTDATEIHYVDRIDHISRVQPGENGAPAGFGGAAHSLFFGVSEEDRASPPPFQGLAMRDGKFVSITAYSLVEGYLMSDSGDTIERL